MLVSSWYWVLICFAFEFITAKEIIEVVTLQGQECAECLNQADGGEWHGDALVNQKLRRSLKMLSGQSSLSELLGCVQHAVLCAFHRNWEVRLLPYSTRRETKALKEVSDLLLPLKTVSREEFTP